MRLKPSKTLRGLKVRAAVAGGMTVLAFTGLALAQTNPARADPTQTLIAVGSDTIQDVYNQFALDASGNLLGSYNATNPVTNAAHETITPVDGTAGVNCAFARPNGSGEGVADLREALNPATTNGGSAPAPVAQQGCVDIARSSSGPSQPSTTGPIVYIPFALDAVAGSTGPTTCTPSTLCPSFNVVTPANGTVSVTPVPTAITQADGFSLANLETLYDNCTPVTVNGVTYDPTGATGTKIDLYIPQAGSGTRNFWATTLGFNPTTPPSCDHDTIVGGPLAPSTTITTPVPVEEHDGTAVATDPNGFGPFSIAQWISQRNGHNNRRHAAIVHSLIPTGGTTAVSPFSNGNPTTGSLNANFPITRDVYSVVSFARVTNSSDPLFNLLNGPNSTVCQDALQIISYGFAPISSTCGEVVASLRAQG